MPEGKSSLVRTDLSAQSHGGCLVQVLLPGDRGLARASEQSLVVNAQLSGPHSVLLQVASDFLEGVVGRDPMLYPKLLRVGLPHAFFLFFKIFLEHFFSEFLLLEFLPQDLFVFFKFQKLHLLLFQV